MEIRSQYLGVGYQNVIKGYFYSFLLFLRKSNTHLLSNTVFKMHKRWITSRLLNPHWWIDSREKSACVKNVLWECPDGKHVQCRRALPLAIYSASKCSNVQLLSFRQIPIKMLTIITNSGIYSNFSTNPKHINTLALCERANYFHNHTECRRTLITRHGDIERIAYGTLNDWNDLAISSNSFAKVT